MLLTLRDRNQLTLPKNIIDALKLHKDDSLEIKIENNKIVLTPVSVIETKLISDLEEAFEDVKNGNVKSFATVDELFKDLDD